MYGALSCIRARHISLVDEIVRKVLSFRLVFELPYLEDKSGAREAWVSSFARLFHGPLLHTRDKKGT